MYDALTPLFDNVTNADLTRYFKSEKLGIKGQGPHDARARAAQGRAHLPRQVQRAAHLRQDERRRDLGRRAGRVAHDRELLLEQARYNARVAVVDAPGLSAIGLVVGLKTFKPSAQTERELAKEVGKLEAATASRAASCCTTCACT